MKMPWMRRARREVCVIPAASEENAVHDIRDSNYYLRPWETNLEHLELHCLLSSNAQRSDASRSRGRRASRRIDATKSFIGPVEFDVLKGFYQVETIEEMESLMLGWNPGSEPTARPAPPDVLPMQQPGEEEGDSMPRFRFPRPRIKAGMRWMRRKLARLGKSLGKRFVAFLRRIFRNTRRRKIRVEQEVDATNILAAIDSDSDTLSVYSSSEYAHLIDDDGIDLEELLNEAVAFV